MLAHRSSSRGTRTALVVAAMLTAAGAAHAQTLADSATGGASDAPMPMAAPTPAALAPAPVASVGPTLDGARAGAARSASTAPLVATAPVSGPRAGRPVALMVVGGAALVIGAIIGGSGGTAVAVGGAVVGLVGLYQFIQ